MAKRINIQAIIQSQFMRDVPLVMAGCAIAALATDIFLIPNGLAAGGLTEGASFDSPLFECDNFIVTPHLGAQSTDASRDIAELIIGKVKEALSL